MSSFLEIIQDIRDLLDSSESVFNPFFFKVANHVIKLVNENKESQKLVDQRNISIILDIKDSLNWQKKLNFNIEDIKDNKDNNVKEFVKLFLKITTSDFIKNCCSSIDPVTKNIREFFVEEFVDIAEKILKPVSLSEDKEIWLSSIETLNSTLNNLFQLINQSKLTQAELNNIIAKCVDRYFKILRGFSEFAETNSSDVEGIDLSDLNPTERLEKLRALLKTSPKTSLLTRLKQNGFTIVELREANLSLAEIKEAHFTATEAREAGYTLNQMKEAKYKLIELTKAGFTEKDLKNVGYNLSDLRNIRTYTVNESFAIGFTLKEIKKVYNFEEIHNSNLFSLSQYKEAGIPIDQIAEWFSVKELLEANYSFSEVVKSKVLKIEDLRPFVNLFTIKDMKKVYNFEEIHNSNLFSLSQYKEAGIPIDQIAEWFSVKELLEANYSFSEVVKSKVLKIEDLNSSITFYDAKKIFSLPLLKETGLYPLQDLRNVYNVPIEVIKESGYSALEAFENGYKLKQIFQAEYPLDEILRIKKFPETELTQAGIKKENIPKDYYN